MPVLLDGDVTINAVRYALLRDIKDKPGLAWGIIGVESEQEGDPGEMVSAKWEYGFQGGMGETRRIGENTPGHAFTEKMDASSFGFVRLPETMATVAPSAAPPDKPTYFFEATDATTWFVYMVCGRYVYKLSISGTTITVREEVDNGATAVAGKPDYFEGKVYVPLGSAVVFDELTTVATPAATDTWTAAGATVVGYAFARAMDGNVAKLARGVATNRVDLVATAPLTGANWSGGATGATGFEVGDSSQVITNLVDTGIIQYVAKKDGLFRFATPGVASKIPLPEMIDDNNGSGLIAVPGTELMVSNHRSGLYMVEGDMVTAIGPDTIPMNSDIPNLTLEPFRLRWYENAVASDDWSYHLGRVVEGGTTRSYIFAANIVNGLQRATWYCYDYINSACRGLYVDKSMRLWTQDGTNIVFWQLGQNGAPDAGRDSNGRGKASTTHRIYLSETPFYRANGDPVPTTKKQLESVEVITRGIGTAAPVLVKAMRDGGSLEDVGANITTAGQRKRYWTAGTSDTAYWMRPVLDITTTADYAITSDPQIHSVIIRAKLRPDLANIVEGVVNCSETWERFSILPKKQRDDLLDIRNTGQSVAVVDPDGNAFNANIIDVGDLQTEQTDGEHITYWLRVRMRQRPSTSVVDINASSVPMAGGITQVDIYEGGVLVGSVT